MEQAITPGRIVYYKDAEEKIYPAMVVSVNEEGAVNLQVFMEEKIEAKRIVEKGEGNGQWDWMPFQKDQQARLAPEVPETSEEKVEETTEETTEEKETTEVGEGAPEKIEN